MARRRRPNPWTSTGEVLIWILFAVLLFPAGFAGWAVGHYTSLGKAPATVVKTVTVGSTSTPTTTTAPATTAATTTSAGGGNVAAGKAVFTSASNNCASCHTFKPANASGQVGPNLDTAPAKDAKADGNMSLAAFVRQSITDPNAYVPKGFQKGLMPTNFGTSLSSSQLNDLVAFILSGTSKS